MPTKHSTAAEMLQWMLWQRADAILALDTPLRELQPDSIHQTRVACRRLRTQLRIFADLLNPEWTVGMREELKWLADALADARDREVLRQRIPIIAQADQLTPVSPDLVNELTAIVAQQELAAVDVALTAIHTDRYNNLCTRLAEITSCQFTPRAMQPMITVMPPIVAAVGRRFSRRANQLRLIDVDSDWHRARIRAKQARYAVEPFTPIFGSKARKAVKKVTALQRILGEHQDAVVMFHALHKIGLAVGTSAELTLACGRLAERERVTTIDIRQEFRRMWHQLRGTTSLWWLNGR